MERKEGRMVHMAQDIPGLGNDTQISCILIGLEAVPNDETAKKLAALTDMMTNKKNNTTTTR